MAFMRYASAVLLQPHVSQRGWGKVRTAAIRSGGVPSQNLVAQATEILEGPLDPDKYLLSHATIVASVDVDHVPNVKTGRVIEHGKSINRKYGLQRITPETAKYINNNGDSWDRPVLLQSFRTFVGAHNFLEHVQIEEQSKGRILDAVARDIGESVYIDILIATDRRHNMLVGDIEAGRMGTLSMGCTVEETICTKCGNVAVDETDMCDHIRYSKLNTFIDEQGQKRVIAELCGHPDIDETGGVTFIEASWVATPAFTGAAIRNVIEPARVSERQAQHIQDVLAMPPKGWSDDATVKAASSPVAVAEGPGRVAAFDFGDEDEGGDEGAEPEAPADPLQGVEDELHKTMLDRVKKRIQRELSEADVEDALSPEDSTMAPNDSIIKEGAARLAARRGRYNVAAAAVIKTASSDADLLNRLVTLDQSFGLEADPNLYRAALHVGSTRSYDSLDAFMSSCRRAVGGPLDHPTARTMLRLGKSLSALETTPKETRS
ncbi:hypothetical protein N9917_00995 [Deltaproteobacteria bacterium]|nr:hypothetical protein [Deltaproteobacteria bacterium]